MNAQFIPGTLAANDRDADIAMKNRRMGLLLWRVANGGVFLFFIFANYLMRTVQTSWPPVGVERLNIAIPAIISVILLLTSIPATRALNAIRHDDSKGMIQNSAFVLIGGVIFIVGLLVHALGVPQEQPYSSIVFTMIGFHALHALVGMGLILFTMRRAQQGRYTRVNHWMVEAAIVFWHFVDLMWVFFFLVIYIV